MRLLVQKYGGSSVADVDKLKRVAARIVATRQQGAHVIAVVSAMGKTTDQLLELATTISSRPPARELDLLLSSGERVASSLLAMAIQELGQPAIALTGPQCGICTSDSHGRAQVVRVRRQRLDAELEQGRVVVVAGFQGENRHGEITTLGRGGSDTTAVAIAAALTAEACQICSDVDGVYSADPRVVPGARRIDELGYDEMHELARHGARVLHVDAVRLAQRKQVTIHACSSFEPGEGTLIRDRPDRPAERRARGVAGRKDLLRLRFADSGAEPEVRALLGESVDDDAVLFRNEGGRHPLELVVAGENVPDRAALAAELEQRFAGTLATDTHLGSVSAVGAAVGLHDHDLERAHRSMGEIPVLDRYRSPWSLSCLLAAEHVDRATQALHRTFVEPAPAMAEVAV